MRRAVFFDVDGTLVDTAPGLTRAFAYAVRKLGLGDPAPESLRDMIGPPLAESFSRRYGLSPEAGRHAVLVQREYYGTRGWKECALFPGVGRMLERIAARGMKLATATGKPETFARAVLGRVGVLDRFDHIGAEDLGHTIGKDRVLAIGMEALGVAAGECVMVGDRDQDAAAARANGVPFIGVAWGYAGKGEWEAAGAERVARTVEELEAMLLG